MELLNKTIPMLGSKPAESMYVGVNKVYGRNILLSSNSYKFEEYFIKNPTITSRKNIVLDELKGLSNKRIAMSFSLELIGGKTIGDIGYNFTIFYADNTSQKINCYYNTNISNAYKGAFTVYKDILAKEIVGVSTYGWVAGINADYLKMENPKVEYHIKTDFTIAPEDI